jgi:cyclic-di-GMP-binding protein
VKQTVKIVSGIASEKAKEIVKAVKDAKLKVQVAIQGEQLRVTGKKKDDLQSVIALLREHDFGIPLQFTNYRG